MIPYDFSHLQEKVLDGETTLKSATATVLTHSPISTLISFLFLNRLSTWFPLNNAGIYFKLECVNALI